MKLVKVGAGVVNQTPLDWDGNKKNILAAIEEAREKAVSILCLPELCISGYGCEDMFHSPAVQQKALQVLGELVPATRGMIVSFGLPIFSHKAVYNAACLAVDGRMVGFVAKRFLAGEGIYYEPRWFKPWPSGKRLDVEVDGARYPFGDIYFNCGGVRIGFEICEDAWVANRPGSHLARRGVDVILNPSGSHFAFAKYSVRKRFVTEGSRAFAVAYVYTNLLGCEAGRIIYDGGALIATDGELVACGSRFSYADYQVLSADIDIESNRMRQSREGSFQPEIGGEDEECVAAAFSFPGLEPSAASAHEPSWEQGGHVKEEEFTRAVGLALYDYLRKSRAAGFVVSLSGGADSSAVCCLVAHAVILGVREIGRERFLAKLSYVSGLANIKEERAIIAKLLLCVYQATRNSSKRTRDAAGAVARAIGAEFLVVDVEDLVQRYVRLVSDAIGRELSWPDDDLALQNVQARVRGPSVWLLANLRGSLLLATSNRSEAAVGYATMDGDTCGGLSPIAGIDKAFLLSWLRWLERVGPHGVGPISELAVVNAQTPTAELRPPEAEQTDEGDLMPYDLLEAIERAAIRDKQSPLEVFRALRPRFVNYGAPQLAVWIERFFRLWCRNQWKRERYAPSFHLDDKNLDPKTWCRFPILSGGFERELKELRMHAAGMK